MNLSLLLQYVLSPGLFTAIWLGLFVGAFYGYSIVGATTKPRFPGALWGIGAAFVVGLGILGLFENGSAPIAIEASVARAILWTVLCGSIPAGRWIRVQVERWRIRRRTRKLEE